MTEQTPQPGAEQTPQQTHVDPATNQLYTVNPITGESEWVTDPATGQPVKATANASAPAAASVLDAAIAGQGNQAVSNPMMPNAQAPLQGNQLLPNSGLAVASLVLGIIAFLISFLPLANLGSIVMGILGAILGIVGLVGISKGTHRGKGLAIAGIILSILALLITFIMYGSAAAYVDKNDSPASETTQQSTPSAQNAAESNSAAEAANSAGAPSGSSTSQDTTAAAANTSAQAEATANSEYAISIDGARLGADYEGKEVAIVSYTWTNNSDKATSFAAALYPKVYQNNVELSTAIVVDDLNSEGYMADVKPGGTVSFELAYEIADHSDITVEVTELISFDDTVLAEQTFSLE